MKTTILNEIFLYYKSQYNITLEQGLNIPKETQIAKAIELPISCNNISLFLAIITYAEASVLYFLQKRFPLSEISKELLIINFDHKFKILKLHFCDWENGFPLLTLSNLNQEAAKLLVDIIKTTNDKYQLEKNSF